MHNDDYGRRRCAIVGHNIDAQISRGIDGRPCNRRFCGILTLTFERSACDRLISNHNALLRFKNFLRTWLKRRFRAGIFIIETTEAGFVHVHIVVLSENNLAAGFDWGAYNAMKMIEKQARQEGRPLTLSERRQRRRLGCSLTINPHMRALWSELRRFARRRNPDETPRIDRAELTPLHGTPAQVASYLVKSLARGDVEGLEPKTRRFGSWGWKWDRKVSDRPRGVQSERYRRNMKLICEFLGISHDDADYKARMRELFGSRWGWHSLRASTMIDRYRRDHLEANPPDDLLLRIIQDTLGHAGAVTVCGGSEKVAREPSAARIACEALGAPLRPELRARRATRGAIVEGRAEGAPGTRYQQHQEATDSQPEVRFQNLPT